MKIELLAKGSGDAFAITNVLSFLVSIFFVPLVSINIATAQTSSLSFSAVPYTDYDIISPGRGAEQWHNSSGSITYPADDFARLSLDVYYRFTWNRVEGPELGSYHWDYFDGLVRSAINKGQKLSFGIMSCYPDGSDSPGIDYYDNGDAAYPQYLHQLMQSENYTDWKTTGSGPTDGYGSWVPNWNSPYYLERLRALHEALYAHINSSVYTAVSGPNAGKTIAYKDVIFSIDIRGYGSWGEWHSAGIIDEMSSYPEGTRPTASTLKTIIDYHANVFTDHPLSVMISVFDAERLSNTYTPKEVGAYALERSNNWGKFGWRRDNWGATDDYLDVYLRGNLNFFGDSGPFNALITERWKTAPITGEPPGWPASLYGSCVYDDMERQVREYHATSVGNGNYGTTYLDDCAKENLRAAFKAAGYRIILEGGSISSTINAGSNFGISLNWKNIGIAPTYEKWDVVFELKDNDNAVVWSGVSQFSPGAANGSLALLPSSTATVASDNFSLPASIPAGNYKLDLIIKDPAGYRAPLPLAIQGRHNDGSYTLKNVVVGTSTDPIPPPITPPPSPAEGCIAPTAVLSTNGGCNGEPVELVLSSAIGVGPFDVVVNGITYNNIAAGSTITTINDETIWSTNPNTVTDIDQPVELGVKFSSSVAGFIKGIRFYSGNEVDGNYTGHLWSNDGTLLASADFSNVTANGWQQVLFSEPVAISAGTIYVASYYTSAGIYAATSAGLEIAVSNGGSLTALGNDTEGGNGVYSYGEPGFPLNTYNANNYWVDVLFSQGASTFELTSITDNAGCTSTGLSQSITASGCADQQRSAVSATTADKTETAVDIKVEDTVLANELSQNFPNPFSDQTVINYKLAKPAKINLSLFDMNGRLVKILVNGSKEVGAHTLSVNAGSLPAGVYFYKLQTGNYSAVKRMIIQK